MPPKKRVVSKKKKDSGNTYAIDTHVPLVDVDAEEFDVLYNKKGAKKAGGKRARAAAEAEDLDVIEDLDFDNDDDYDGTALDVLPGEAHSNRDQAILEKPHRRKPKKGSKADQGFEDAIDRAYTLEEEEEMANDAIRAMRRGMHTDDFAVAGIDPTAAAPVDRAGRVSLPDVAQGGQIDTVVESVAADFAALTENQRLELIQSESPEVTRLVEEFRANLEECRALVPPLKQLLFNTAASQKKPSDNELIAFLETKVQIMLAYCVHIAFYLCMKVEGQKIADHPVVDRLVDLRVYLEKMWPVEQKLQYGINKLLVAAGAQIDDETGATRPKSSHDYADGLEDLSRVKNLRPVAGNQPLVKRTVEMDELRDRRRAEKAAADAAELEAEEESMFTRLRGKQASDIAAAHLKTGSAPVELRAVDDGMRDEEDAFLSRMYARKRAAADADEEENGGGESTGAAGTSLISKLRAQLGKEKKFEEATQEKRKKEQEAKKKKERRAPPQYFAPGELSDEDGFNSEDMDEDDLEQMYDDLVVQEEQNRDEEETTTSGVANDDDDSEVKKSRRKANKNILDHRGLTKNRPKERKNPRINKRLKAQSAEKKQQSRRPAVRREGDSFSGVNKLNTGITRSSKIN